MARGRRAQAARAVYQQQVAQRGQSLLAGQHTHACARCLAAYWCPQGHADLAPAPVSPWHQLCQPCRAAYQAVADDHAARLAFQSSLIHAEAHHG
jgi:hypothetical protein